MLFNTEKLLDDSMYAAMVMVRVPSSNSELIQRLPFLILDKYNTYVGVTVLPQTDKWYFRVSAQIWNELSDFDYFGRAVLETLAQYDVSSTTSTSSSNILCIIS